MPRRAVPLRRVLLLVLLLAPAGAPGQEVVGPQVCRSCHPEAYEHWKQSPHARAEARLGKQAKDPACTQCHAPQREQGLEGVSCEGCHGAGKHYSPAYVMRDPELSRLVGLKPQTEKLCRTCHDASSPSLLPYEHTRMLERIDHWTREKQAAK